MEESYFGRIIKYLSGFEATKYEIKFKCFPISIKATLEHQEESLRNETEKAISGLDSEENALQSIGYSFIGREQEKEFLNNAIEELSHVLWLSGVMGIGKSTLALEIANQLCSSKNYETKHIFVDLRGNSEHPLTLDDVKSRIINELRPQTHIPNNMSLLSELYNDVISNRKLVLFLDNARDTKQIQELFCKQQGSEWLMIVTSRRKLELDFDGVSSLEVKELKKEDAKKLIEEIVPAIGKLSEEVIKLCNYMPLAMLWLGKLLNKKVEDREDYIEKLRMKMNEPDFYESGKPKSVATKVLSVNYDYLNKDEQRDWLDLAVFEGTFDTHALSSIWRLFDYSIVERRINTFLSLSLVEFNKSTKRYFLHSAAKHFAETKRNPERYDENIEIYATHFMIILDDLNKKYIHGGEKFKTCRALFDLEWDNIFFGYKLTKIKTNEGNNYFKHLCIKYPINGFDILSLRQHPDERIDWIKTGIKEANKLSMRNEKGILQGLHALALRHIGGKKDIERSIILLESAIKICSSKETEDKWKGIHLSNKGNAYAALGDYNLAIEDYNKALEIFEKTNDHTGKSIVLNNLSRAFIDLGETKKANKFCEEALEIVKSTGDLRRQAGAYTNKGLINRHFGQVDSAISYYERALNTFQDLGDQLWEGITLCLLGRALMDQEEAKIIDGIVMTNEAIKIFENFGEKRWIGIARGNLGTARIRIDNVLEAKKDLEEAIKIAEETGDERRRAIHYNCLGEAFVKLGNYGQAIDSNQVALSIAIRLEDKRRQAGALVWLGIATYKNKEILEALEYLIDAKSIAEDIGDKRKEKQASQYIDLIEKVL